jgi:uncharacterized protein YoxC
MIPLAQAVIVVCTVALTGVLISTLLAIRKTALRAESVLAQVEREIRPLASQIESLTGELSGLSKQTAQEMDRVSVVLTRVEEVAAKLARVVGAIAGLTQIGQLAGAAVGVKKGLAVFIRRLKDNA